MGYINRENPLENKLQRQLQDAGIVHGIGMQQGRRAGAGWIAGRIVRSSVTRR